MVANSGGTDGYVRIPAAALPTVQLHHLMSDIDMSIAVADVQAMQPGEVVTGFTEWAGSWQGLDISLGWDWAVVGGIATVINPAEIRTNVQVIAQDGRAEPAAQVRRHFLNWIELHPWREIAIDGLLSGRSGGVA